MSLNDGLLLVGGIIIPTVFLFVYAACLSILIIFVGYTVYYRLYKAHLINTHPDKLLLEEIRRQY